MGSRSWPDTWRVAALILAPLALYLPSLGLRFLETYDDDRTVLDGTAVHDLRDSPLQNLELMFDPTANRRTPGLSAEYLPVRDLSFAVDQLLWGTPPPADAGEGARWRLNPVGYRLANVLLYGLCGLAFAAVLLRLGAGRAVAVAAAILWLVHPLHVENVVWISSRKDVLSGVLFLLAVLLHLRASDGGAGRVTVFALVVAALACGLAAMLAKATAVVLLPCLVLCDLVRAPAAGQRRARRIRFTSYALQAMVLAIVLWIHMGVLASGLGSHPYVQESDLSLAARIGRAAPVVLVYLRLAVAPIGLSTMRDAPEVGAAGEWLALAVIAGLVVGSVVAWRRTRAVSSGMLWFLGCLAPVLNVIVGTPHAIADRYLFLPSLGIAAMGGAAFASARRRWPRAAVWFLAGVVAVGAAATLAEAGRWRTDHVLWQSVVASQGGSARAHARLGHAYQLLAARAQAEGRAGQAERMMDECLIELRRAIRLEDRDLESAESAAARAPVLVTARVNLAGLLVARARQRVEPDSQLALEAVRALGPVIASVPSSRAAVVAALRDVPGYAEARRLLDGAYETWASTRGLIERMVAQEDSSQIAAWRALTIGDANSWGACLGVLERENELALEREGGVDPERLAAESPGYLRVRRAAAYIFLNNPERAADLVFHLDAEGDEFPVRYRAALAAARELLEAGELRQAEASLKALWTATPQFPEAYRLLAEVYRRAGGSELAAVHEAAASALVEARKQ